MTYLFNSAFEHQQLDAAFDGLVHAWMACQIRSATQVIYLFII